MGNVFSSIVFRVADVDPTTVAITADTFNNDIDIVRGNAVDSLPSTVKSSPVKADAVDNMARAMDIERTRYGATTTYADINSLSDSDMQMRVGGNDGSFIKGRDGLYRSYLNRGYDLTEPIHVMVGENQKPEYRTIGGKKMLAGTATKLRGHLRVAAAKLLRERAPEIYAVVFPNDAIPVIVHEHLNDDAELAFISDHEKKATGLTNLEKFRHAFAYYQRKARAGMTPTQNELSAAVGAGSGAMGQNCARLVQLDPESRSKILSGEWPLGAIVRLVAAGVQDTGKAGLVRLPGKDYGTQYNAVRDSLLTDPKSANPINDDLSYSDAKAFVKAITLKIPALEGVFGAITLGKKFSRPEGKEAIDLLVDGHTAADALIERLRDAGLTDMIAAPTAADSVENAANAAGKPKDEPKNRRRNK